MYFMYILAALGVWISWHRHPSLLKAALCCLVLPTPLWREVAPQGALLQTHRVTPSSGLLEQLCQYWPNYTKLSPCFHSDISDCMSIFGLFLVTLKITKQKGDVTRNVTTVHQVDVPAGTNGSAPIRDSTMQTYLPRAVPRDRFLSPIFWCTNIPRSKLFSALFPILLMLSAQRTGSVLFWKHQTSKITSAGCNQHGSSGGALESIQMWLRTLAIPSSSNGKNLLFRGNHCGSFSLWSLCS